jgi:pyruvate formate lyase activating enzyme
MKIGGYHPCSFSDFPGRPAAVVFTQGCNFRCPFCHNGQLLGPGGDLIPPEEILYRLSVRRRRIDSVVITGGEPTLQAGLPEFLRSLRQIGLQIKLDTNGSFPDALARLIDAGLVDYIAMDVKAPWSRYRELAGAPVDPARIAESMCMIAASGVAHEFRTTAVYALLSAEDLAGVRALIPCGSPYRLLPFRAEHALDPRLRGGSAERLGCNPFCLAAR